MLTKGSYLVAFCALLAMAGCASQKAPATQAVTAADAALAAIHDQAEKYAPSDLQQVQGSIDAMKGNLASGDYKAVLAAAPNVTSQISALKDDVATKQEAAQAALTAAKQQWDSLNTEVPKMVAAIQSRVDVLKRSRRLPKNISKQTLQAATDGLASAKSGWQQATDLFTSGQAVDAVAKAQTAKDNAAKVMQMLGLKSG